MKTLNDYLNMPYRMEVVPDTSEGGYIAYFPELKGCITCGETVEKAAANAIDAKREWLSAAIEDGVEIPYPEAAEKYSGQFKLRLPKSLHKQLAEAAGRDGISMNQYCVYLLSQNNALHTHNG